MKRRGRTQANTTIKRHTADYHLNDGLFPQKLKNTTSASERAKAPFCILSKKRVGARRGDPGRKNTIHMKKYGAIYPKSFKQERGR
jgi:hypothetical protein